MKLAFIVSVAAPVMICCASTMAQDAPIIMDGKCDAVYGNPKSSQVVHTGFGNATDGVNSYANGSELDAAYFKIDSANGYLYMCMPGNLESNFNKLDIFIDSVPGEGQNEIRSDNPDIDYNGLNKMGRDDVNGYAGLKFDTGFAADFCLMTTLGGDPVTQYANIAQVLTNGGGVGAYIGSGIFSGPTGVNLLDDQVYGCQLSISNANTAGVSGDSANPGSGCGVVTGIEMKIPLGLLAWDGASDIKICAFINGPDHDFVSNQVLGSLPIGSNNLGGDGTGGHLGGFPGALRGVNFATIPGDQYLSVFGADACGLCFGDLDASGEVDSGDVALALLDSGICSDCAADLDGSGEVDSGDVALLLLSAGACQ